MLRCTQAALGPVCDDAEYWIAGECILFKANEILPFTSEAFTTSRLALVELDVDQVQLLVVLLYSIQYSFIDLRSRCCTGDVVSTADIRAIMHAAYSIFLYSRVAVPSARRVRSLNKTEMLKPQSKSPKYRYVQKKRSPPEIQKVKKSLKNENNISKSYLTDDHKSE